MNLRMRLLASIYKSESASSQNHQISHTTSPGSIIKSEAKIYAEKHVGRNAIIESNYNENDGCEDRPKQPPFFSGNILNEVCVLF